LPLQKKSRAGGNTEFINPDDRELRPYPDQWTFLSGIKRLSSTQVAALLEQIPAIAVGSGAAAAVSPLVRQKYPAPKQIRCVLGPTVSLEKSGIPPWMLSQFKHLASIHNPKFYERQKLRLSTFQIPRLIRCYEEDLYHIHMPRGILEDIREIAKNAGSELSIVDQRSACRNLSLQFRGSLTPSQERTVQNLFTHEMGVLVAPPGAGKTVMGCFLVGKRNVPTLILAHRKPILEQWRSQLMGLSSQEIGQIGGGRRRQTGIVDLAMIQSLKSIADLETFFANYGFIVVNECHHLPAVTFESCFRRAPVRYVLGLTATPYRSDGLQNIIIMQCGPIRYKMEDAPADLSRRLNIRQTPFSFSNDEHVSIQDIFRSLVNDVIRALKQGRQCLILTQWKEHCRLLADRLIQRGKIPFVLSGAIRKKERALILETIADTSPEKQLLVVATGQYLGEGFDCPRIDTLFLVVQGEDCSVCSKNTENSSKQEERTRL
jgi:Type III restriction enzyme, res subunit